MATYILKKDNAGLYYWVVRSDKNGKTIAKSSESYYSKQGAKESIEWVRTNAKGAELKDEA